MPLAKGRRGTFFRVKITSCCVDLESLESNTCPETILTKDGRWPSRKSRMACSRTEPREAPCVSAEDASNCAPRILIAFAQYVLKTVAMRLPPCRSHSLLKPHVPHKPLVRLPIRLHPVGREVLVRIPQRDAGHDHLAVRDVRLLAHDLRAHDPLAVHHRA